MTEIQEPLDALQKQLEVGQQRQFEEAIDTSDGMIMGQKDTAWFFGSDRYAYVFNQGGKRERIDFGGTNPRWVRLGTAALDGDDYAVVKAVDLPTYRKVAEYYWREEAGLSADDALAAASWRARAWLGVEDGLAEGSTASFVVYADDPRDLAVLRHPSHVVLRGHVFRP